MRLRRFLLPRPRTEPLPPLVQSNEQVFEQVDRQIERNKMWRAKLQELIIHVEEVADRAGR